MFSLRANQALIADKIILDGRLALFHKAERWLAVADLIWLRIDRALPGAGSIVMATISDRLRNSRLNTIRRLIILGDLVHDRPRHEAAQFSAISGITVKS
jgi:metallophosphoesterase superfamily enzyme